MSGQSLEQLVRRAGYFDWGSAVPLEDIRGEVAIAGIGETPYSGPSGRNARDLCLEAVAAAIADAGLQPADIDGLMVSKGIADQITPEDFHAHFGTSQPIWFSREGGGMIWAATSAHAAAQALRRGEARHIVNVFAVDWASRRADGRGTPGDWHASEVMKAHFELPFGWYPQPVYFATFARRYMHEFGLTERQLAALPVAFRRHANRHPGAVMREKSLSVEDYLDRAPLADPLRMEDCCLISDGGAAYVYTSVERARDLRQRPVIVEGVGRGIVDGAPYISQQKQITATPQTFAAPWAFAMADANPGELDVIAVYDCFSITALMQIEDMGLCSKGEGGHFIQDGRLDFDRPRSRGGIPCNTHGGLLSHAYVLGIAHVVELVKQLRGEAVNQVENAELAAYAGFTADEGSTLVLRRG
ncbi:thiolase family protein [Parahaliea maris]|uniref:Thiolase family protein n=1 Tax=Parahaliea maris TaxID=2716870 RepID=A0A5C9A7Z0_9GAMM|nr:thiolase family protein [Parahaliea maris]TXS96152.1 thiolase family protein [Parahaliea maris]